MNNWCYMKVDIIEQKCDGAADTAQDSEIKVKLIRRHCTLELQLSVTKLGDG